MISIITVAYNNIFGLEETIKSVIGQTHKNIEFIIVDGGSNEGSKELLEVIHQNYMRSASRYLQRYE